MQLLRLSAVLLAIACTDKSADGIDTGPVVQDSDTQDSDTQETGAVDVDGDGYDADVDCNDSDSTVHPDAIEVCDGVDQDCDDVVDDNATDAPTWYDDADGDGDGDVSTAVQACDAPQGAVATGTDCDDTESTIHPGAEESDCSDPVDYNCDGSVGYADADADGFAACKECDDASASVNPDGIETCNDIDDNCDGTTDEGATDATDWYLDSDGDGYGDLAMPTTECNAPEGYVADGTDCNDTDPAVNPGATEVCDALDTDEDCNGSADDADAGVDPSSLGTWYMDADLDGYGDDANSTASCDAGTNWVADNTDCDDSDPSFHPGADESDCTDPNDYNCDGSTGATDSDGDGFVACEECDDASADVNPDATETCNGFDDDCNGTIDEEGAVGEVPWYLDADSDGYGDADSAWDRCEQPSGYVGNSEDCDDAAVAVNPGGTEVCNGVDDDCDGGVDEAGALDEPTWYADADEDGYGSTIDVLGACAQPSGYLASTGDCDDANGDTNPGASEQCNGIDDNCDGSVDEDGAVDASTWYLDGDADGFGGTSSTQSCTMPSGYVADASDCDDGDSAVNPDAIEVCNGIDDDCDRIADSFDAVDATSYYQDLDSDGYGSALSMLSCDPLEGFVLDGGDCDDDAAAVNPGVTEYCNGFDDNCDDQVDESGAAGEYTWYPDNDLDAYGDPDLAVLACSGTQPTGFLLTGGDCQDADPTTHPNADEYCDGVDHDCDSLVDEDSSVDASTWYLDADTDGYGSDTTAASCALPSGYAANSDDCDDGSGDVSPGALETCNGVDDDCDGSVDEDDAVDATVYYADGDNDGFGNPDMPLSACATPSGYVANNADCDDTNAALYPDASGVCAAGASCGDAFDNGAGYDGIYTIDPDGPDGATAAYDAWCDMTEDGGGWTLLLSADGASTTWGNNAPAWASNSWDSSAPPSTLTDADYKSEAYVDLPTSEIRICYDGTSRCYTFNHGYDISLYDFFADGITYVDYSSGMYGIPNAGSASTITDYLADLGFSQHEVSCTWLGINDTRSISSIGLLGDWNGGCTGSGVPYSDDLAIGVGLQSCYDANGCNNGGTANAAGQSRGLNGVDDSGVFGPWHVFGR